MPVLKIPKPSGATVRASGGPRVGRPVDTTAGLRSLGRVAGQVGEQDFRIGEGQKDIDAQKEIASNLDTRRRVDAYEKEAIAAEKAQAEKQLTDDKLSAANALIRYQLDSDAVLREFDGALASGEIDRNEYQDKIATRFKTLGQDVAAGLSETAKLMFNANVLKSGQKNVLAVRDRLDKHQDQQLMAKLTESTEQLERLATEDLAQALTGGAGLFSKAGPYAQINGADKAAKAGAQFKERATLAHFRAKGAGAAESTSALKALRVEVADNADMDPMQQSTMLSSIDSRMGVLENRRNAAIAKRERQAQTAVNSLQTLSDGGFPISEAYASRVAAQVKGTQHEGTVNEIIKGAAESAGFGSMSVDQQTATVQAMTNEAASKGVTPASSKRLAKYMRMRDATARDYAADPWQAAADRGQIDAVPPIDHTSIDGLAASMEARMSVIDTIEQAAGRPVSPLQPKEAEAVGRMLSSMAADEKAAMLGELSQSVGPDRMMALAGQISEGDETLGVVAAASAQGLKTPDGQNLAALIIKGDEAIKGKRVKIDNMAGEGIESEMREYLGDAIASPVAQSAAVNAAIKVWAAKEAEGSSMDYSEALEAVAGAVVDHGGRRTLAPMGWTADDFERSLSDLTPENISKQTGGASMFVDGTQIPADQVADQLEAMQLQQGRGGKYMMLSGGVPITDADRKPIYIKLDKPAPEPGMWERLFGK